MLYTYLPICTTLYPNLGVIAANCAVTPLAGGIVWHDGRKYRATILYQIFCATKEAKFHRPITIITELVHMAMLLIIQVMKTAGKIKNIA